MQYLRVFISICLQHGLWFWISLAFSYALGIGWYSDYQTIRNVVMNWPILSWLPEQPSPWLLILPFLFWVFVSCLHKETMRKLRAGRIIFDPMEIVEVPLFSAGRQIATTEILRVYIRNEPYDSSGGHPIEHAFGRISIYDSYWHCLKTFDNPRWSENPKPGYQGAPSDHFPPEWNLRTLHPNGSRNGMDLFTKQKILYQAYAFRGSNQLRPQWEDTEIALPPGEYKISLQVKGDSMVEPAYYWFELKNPGKDESLMVSALPSGLSVLTRGVADYFKMRNLQSNA